METPSSSTRRVTRSQALTAVNNIPISRKNEDPEKASSIQRNGKPDRSALLDITNDSPIVGLATGSLETPSSLAKMRNQPKQTPGSGEALLRCQVKTLLQKVEEEAELSKLSFEYRPSLHVRGFVNSPSGLLAPTPANTPQFPNLSCDEDHNSDLKSSNDIRIYAAEGEPKISQAIMDIFVGKDEEEETLESPKSQITRSLLLDFSDKSIITYSSDCSSGVTYQEGSACREKSMEEDDASVWSIQVNASTQDEDEDEDEDEEEVEDHEEVLEEEDYEEEVGDDDKGYVDDLCEGLGKISVKGNRIIPEFTGKHTRFIYNSDDEIEGEEEEGGCSALSPSALRLKGMPTPEGKHLRFPDDADD